MEYTETWFHPPTNTSSPIWSFFSYLLSTLLSLFSKFWLGVLNRPLYYNRKQFLSLLEKRPEGRGLLTVSNHYSCLDDPLLWGLREWWHAAYPKYLRWTPSAHNICFTNYRNSLFFSLGRCVPVIRGDGVYQRGIDYCINKLDHGEWVHIFPEGKVNEFQERIRLKWGVGRLVAECDIPPIVLPIYHIGLDDILPNKKPYIPQIGKNVTILVGDPIDYTDDLVMLNNHDKDLTEKRKYITDDIQEKLFALRVRAEQLHADRRTSAPR